MAIGATFLMQLPTNGKEAEDGPSPWIPPTHMEDKAEILGSWLWPGSAFIIVATWGVNQSKKDLVLSVSPSLGVMLTSNKQIFLI